MHEVTVTLSLIITRPTVNFTLLDFLTENELRDMAGPSVYQRGHAYFRANRVDIQSADLQEAQCSVRGTRLYRVELWVQSDELDLDCTCPHAESGWFCKHMVAAGLAVHTHLAKLAPSAWRSRFDRMLIERKPAAKKASSPYWIFLSLQPETTGWTLVPYRLWLDRIPEGILPLGELPPAKELPELIKHNQWMLAAIKEISKDFNPQGAMNYSVDADAFIRLIQQQTRRASSYYYYESYDFPIAEDLSLLRHIPLPIFLGSSSNPVRRELQLTSGSAEMQLRLEKDAEHISMQAALKLGETLITLRNANVDIVSAKEPVWVLVDDKLIEVEVPYSVDLLYTWLRSPEVRITTHYEDEFLENYFPALAERFFIESDLISWIDAGGEPAKRLYLTDEDGEFQVHLFFGYDEYEVPYQSQFPEQTIRRTPGTWELVRVHRQPTQEEEVYSSISSAHNGLKYGRGDYDDHVFLLRARVDPIDFLMRHIPRLAEAGFEIYGEEKLKTARVNRNSPTLSLNISSGIDWFDIEAVITFGDVETTLKEVRRALRKKEQYVKLADGTIGEIPDEWIERYKHLFGLGEQTDDGMRLSNHHIALIDDLLDKVDQNQIDEEFRARRKRLLEFEGIEAQALPAGFTGELRPYQKAGYDWMHFLHEYQFGGCLADDMGLGKTIEALAFLLSLRTSSHAQSADLIVLPRSLLVNWQREAARFAPSLRFYEYYGAARETGAAVFDQYDLVLTTYGTMMRDIETLREYKFHYVVLDESQAIKNPLAKTSKAARLLRSDHRLVLTGTPVENNTFELWSQFAFLNPGLLGSLEYFKREFSNPIENRGDETAAQMLRALVYPFILRRTKAQVAPELPPRTERILYCDMEPAQKKLYAKTREYYRAMLLGIIEEQGMNDARMKVLEGLLRLRQISNHPRLTKEDFRGDSAKFELLVETLETLRAEGHKALIFSQFVQMLKIVREELDVRKIPYAYLDGRTRKRQERVDIFQNDPEIPFFLISLKAGGVGLNLTAADYVIHIDPWWNPAVEMQASDRTHRIGQDKPVFVYKLITRDTVEEKILQLQEKKKKLVEQLITTESSFFKGLTADDVDVLFS